MTGVTFLPVYGGSSTKEFSAWNSKSYFKYPYFFTSAAYAYKQFPNIRKDLEIDNDVQIFADSGGYQALTQGMRVDPEEIIDWYNRNTNWGNMLDYPPYSGVHKNVASEQTFEDNLKSSLKSTAMMIDRKKNGLKLFGVIHGNTPKHFDKWRKSIDEIYDWDGYAMSPAPINDAEAVLKLIRYILDRKIEKPLHFLVTGEKVCFILLSRFSRFYNHRITVDSSSHLQQAANMWFITPGFGKLLNISKTTSNGFAVRKPWCDCPVCRKVSYDELHNPRILQYHNLWIMLQQYAVLNSVADANYDALADILSISVEYVKILDQIIGGQQLGLHTFMKMEV